MKSIILLTFVVGAIVAAPQSRQDLDRQIQTVRSEHDSGNGDGNYKFNYELTDGTVREETGELRNLGPDVNAQTVTGTISWTSPEGQLIQLRYVADENGYRPVGDHLPK